MTPDDVQREARARAHRLLGEAICFAPRPDFHTSATCDRVAAAFAEIEGERERLREALRVLQRIASPPPAPRGTPEHLVPNMRAILASVARLAAEALASTKGA